MDPDHAKKFDAEIFLDHKSYGRVQVASKKEAESNAAQIAIRSLKEQVFSPRLNFVKRIILPKGANATYYPSVPESTHACLTVNEWLRTGNPCLILLSESITKAESWAEDITGIAEQICPKENFRFHLFDEAPESTHPDAFDKICERTSVLSILSEPFGEKKW